eukprot:CAMPEP_0194060468 /NCGR_PEP_ID=MMETSP0009_2-20130614/71826_1 /TAXON_ID=210454 /ORGANISM="Grammatophora oceanica, Strain CCMP 410" /LENGTH=32 /DNA_ID= /DNA_START= /DNA_END= /DNA_ORIENTATION=
MKNPTSKLIPSPPESSSLNRYNVAVELENSGR